MLNQLACLDKCHKSIIVQSIYLRNTNQVPLNMNDFRVPNSSLFKYLTWDVHIQNTVQMARRHLAVSLCYMKKASNTHTHNIHPKQNTRMVCQKYYNVRVTNVQFFTKILHITYLSYHSSEPSYQL